MSQREAALVSLPEFNQRHRGWQKQWRDKWELARWEVWHIYLNNPYIKQGQKPRKPSDILALAGEREEQRQITAEDCHINEEQRNILTDIFNKLRR